MLGAIIDDMVGSVYEFDNIKTTNFSLFVRDSNYTDDSVMSFYRQNYNSPTRVI